MRIKKFSAKILLGFVFASTILPSYAANLIQVFQQALQSDPTFKAAGEQRLSETQNVPIARSFLLPQLFLSTATSLYNIQENQTKPLNRTTAGNPALLSAFNNGTFKYNSNGYTVNLSQVIFNYESWAAFQQAKTTVKIANADYAAAAQNLISRVAASYFSVLLAEDELRYIQAEKKAIYQQLDQVMQQYKVGLVAITGVYQAQAQYDRILAQEIEAKNNIVNAKENLRAITGVFYDDLDGLSPKMPLVRPTPNDVDEWVEMAQRLNWTLQAACFTSEAANQQIGIEFSGHLPIISAVGQQQLTRTGSTPSGKINNRVSSLGVQLELPVFQGGLVTSETKQARYNYLATLDEQEKTSRTVINETHQSYNNITNGISKIKADKRAIVSGESSLRSTVEAYKVGTQTMLDVLQSQQDLFNTFRTFANDQYDYINATIALKEAAGTLSIRDLQEINDFLTDPKKTFSYMRTKQLEDHPLGFSSNGIPAKDVIGAQGLKLQNYPQVDYDNLDLKANDPVPGQNTKTNSKKKPSVKKSQAATNQKKSTGNQTLLKKQPQSTGKLQEKMKQMQQKNQPSSETKINEHGITVPVIETSNQPDPTVDMYNSIYDESSQ